MVAYLLPIPRPNSHFCDASPLITRCSRPQERWAAPERAVFTDIYFPQVRPALFSGSVLVFVLALGFFLTRPFSAGQGI